MNSFALTPSQTVGPFFEGCLLREDRKYTFVLATPGTEGTRVNLTGYVYDGDGQPITDAIIEIWQANGEGRYSQADVVGDMPLDTEFTGFGRAGTDENGAYVFETIKPGAVPFDMERMQAPHVCVAVFARGLLNHLFTRLYFADEQANESDPVLGYVPAERRATLIAQPVEGEGVTTYRFDIVLQGAGETVFFNL